MDIRLSLALLVSLSLHLALISSIPGAPGPDKATKAEKAVEVDYVRIEKERPVPRSGSAETPPIEIANKVVEEPDVPSAAPTSPSVINKTSETENLTEKIERKEASRDEINYYQLIREKIRRRLKSNYRDFSHKGDVILVFTIDSGGGLVDSGIDKAGSSNSEYLVGAAMRSLREAAPFPPFPSTLSAQRMSFNLQVSFKKR